MPMLLGHTATEFPMKPEVKTVDEFRLSRKRHMATMPMNS